ncbi:MAG: autotransporter outer membrane beta-barrel domain-containing protein [Dialister sp.]|nr:autotransporter outer membrane beta-barrel domain-containing protein [Dialister sp.]
MKKSRELSVSILAFLMAGTVVGVPVQAADVGESSSQKEGVQIVEDVYYGQKARDYWKGAGVSDGKGHYTFDKDETITASRYNQTLKDNAANNYFVNKLNMYAPIMKGGDNAAVVDMTGHDLNLVADHAGVSVDPAGIYVTSGTLTINNPGAITSTTKDGQAGYGIFVQGTRGMGEWRSGNGNAKLVIDNDDSLKNAVKVRVNSDNNYGLLRTEGNTGSGELIIKGLVDLEANNGAAITAWAGNIDVGGGTIKGRVDTKFGGRVAVNASLDADGEVQISSALRDVKITGDVTAEGKGSVILGLGTKDSYLTGVVNSDVEGLVHPGESYVLENNGVLRPQGFDHPVDTKWTVNPGYVHLALENGAVWSHQQESNYYTLSSSHLTDLKGKNGIINQNSARSILIDHFDGTVSVNFKHDTSQPTTIIGGDITITVAEPDSRITLITDSKGLEKGLSVNASASDKDLVNRTMNMLAGKLKYAQFADKYLTGTVEIAEGLLTPSATMNVAKTGAISFRKNGDQAGTGYYDYAPSSGTTSYRDDIQIVEDVYYGQKARDYWKGAGVSDGKGHYTFDTDETITASRYNQTLGNNAANNYFVNKLNMYAPIMKGGDNAAVIDMTGHDLNLVADHAGAGVNPAGIYVTSGALTINNPSAIKVDVKDGQFGYGLVVEGTSGQGTWESGSGHAKLIINNDDSSNHAVKIRTDGASSNYGLLFANGNTGSAQLDIKGLVDLKTSSHDAVRAWNGAVNIGGGSIISEGADAWNAIESGFGSLVTVNASIDKNENVTVRSDSRDVKITGDITAESKGRVVLGLTTEDSYFKGAVNADVPGMVNSDVTYTEELNGVRTADPVFGNDHKEWMDNPGDVYMALNHGASWDHQQVSAALDAPNKNSKNESRLARLSADGGIIEQNSERDIRVERYGGNASVIYRHDSSDPTAISGGNFRIESADAGSSIQLITDSKGLKLSSTDETDRLKVTNTLNALAHKLIYEGYAQGERNLKGRVEIAEGLLTPRVTAFYMETSRSAVQPSSGDIAFGNDGAGELGQMDISNVETTGNPGDQPSSGNESGSVVIDKPDIHYAEETTVQKGIKSVQLAAAQLWRGNSNDLHRRMGDLRLASDIQGVWARYLGGRNTMDSQNTNLRSNYNIYQAGYDKKVNNDWIIGAAVDYGTSSDSYRENGSGDGKLASLAVYGTMMKDDGQYLDIILRGSHIKNDFTIHTSTIDLDADYSTWGASMSVEYGKKFTYDNGFYITPSIEFTFGRLNGKDYTAGSTAGKLYVKQDDFNSAVGRIGISLGKQNQNSSYFTQFGLAHEFSGDMDTHFADTYGNYKSSSVDLGDTWYEMELGGSFKLNRNTYFYGTYTRSFASTLNEDWRLDLGLRFSF